MFGCAFVQTTCLKMLLKIYFLVPFILYIFEANGRPNGAPNSACEDLSPRHGKNIAQNDTSPFKIKVNSTKVENGQIIEVTVESNDSKRRFRGLILQAREDISVKKTTGNFIIENGNEIKPITCQNDADTVTHINRDDKSIVKFYYKAKAGFEGVVTIT